VQVFILDEADRMLDMGFIRDIKRVLKMLPAKRQNLMFSATYSDDIRDLAKSFVRDPVNVQVTPRNATAEKVEQSAYRVPKDHKRTCSRTSSRMATGTRCWCSRAPSTAPTASRSSWSAPASPPWPSTGNKSQNARVRALEDFKDNKITALVATEVAARGLDIKELPHVVNYELPNVPEDYVHRIGRTARAGSTGAAVSLVSPDEVSYLRDIEKLLKQKIEFVEAPKFEIKEGSHPTRAEREGEPAEHRPHQDPRRRPEHRGPRGQQGGRGQGRGQGGSWCSRWSRTARRRGPRRPRRVCEHDARGCAAQRAQAAKTHDRRTRARALRISRARAKVAMNSVGAAARPRPRSTAARAARAAAMAGVSVPAARRAGSCVVHAPAAAVAMAVREAASLAASRA
jgi:ATP-dependent RNA helicase RhlE